MPVAKTFGRQQDQQLETQTTEPKRTTPITANEKYNAAKENAKATGSNEDDVKYKVAVEAARNNLADKENVSDDELKAEIDKQLKIYGASKSGDELRGENGFTKTLDFGRNLINDAMLGLGNGADWLFNNTIGNLVGAVGGEEAGNSVKEFMNGEDLQGAIDIGIDIGLAALGPAGWAAMIGKNAIQQSDNIMQGFNGCKDRITREDIGGDRAALSLLEGIGGTALAAVPVLGKIRNVGKLAKAAEGAAPEVVASKSTEPMSPSTSNALRNLAEKTGVKGPVTTENPLVEQARIAKSINPVKRIGVDKQLARNNDVQRAIDKAGTSKTKLSDRIKDKFGKEKEDAVQTVSRRPGIMKEIGDRMLNATVGAATGAMGGEMSVLEETGENQTVVPAALTGAIAGMLGKRGGVSPRGYTSRRVPAFAYSTMAGMKTGDNMVRGQQPEGMSDEELLAALKVR